MMSVMSNHKVAATQALLSLLVVLITHQAGALSASNPPTARPGCQDHCGNISIPYPFGIGPKCFHDSWFEILCNTESDDPPQATLARLNWSSSFDLKYPRVIPIRSIDIGTSPLPIYTRNNGTLASTGTLVVTNGGSNLGSSHTVDNFYPLLRLDMRGSPFVLMGGTRNSLLLTGCGGSVVIRNIRNHDIVAGCSSLCNFNSSDQSVPSQQLSKNVTSCYGAGCCQASIPTSLDYFQKEFLTAVLQGNNFSDFIQASVVDTFYISNGSAFDAMSLTESGSFAPTILQWRVPDLPIHLNRYANSSCSMQDNPKGYSCKCIHEYYRGNPYLPYGCQVIKECEQCPSSCASSVVGNAQTYSCPAAIGPKKSAMPLALGLEISFGSLLLSALLFGSYRFVKERKQIRQRNENFKRNGGLLLEQQRSHSESTIERTKVFTCNELERATDNFNENRILGRGGQGTVYKGMLANGTIVAIKKSQKIDETQSGPFINEVVILSQIKHRNVVQLFGCCLETEVPLLVYEFIPNGTLFQHIHNPSEDFRIDWKMRLRIALELAEAVAYLHSSSHAPIYHRDIKTSNILLDDKYKAKVSDFGTSKTMLMDQTHVTTCVQGTFGYIDPEFFQSNQFTDRSDVYSFGIVLVELLTSKKPIYADYESMGNKSLASEFLFHMQSVEEL